jgi:alpha-ribazole phosphatase/probable phosphoglycerate mutase
VRFEGTPVAGAKATKTSVVFETHALTEDNEAGRATGWLPGRLSADGRAQAAELGLRRRADGIAAVFTSDLGRAMETVSIAFGGSALPVFADWRLRECDYGEWNGAPVEQVHARRAYLDRPYPGGESWRAAVARVAGFLPDLATRWRGARVVVVGHVATRWAFDHVVRGVPLETLCDADFAWQPGWEYDVD